MPPKNFPIQNRPVGKGKRMPPLGEKKRGTGPDTGVRYKIQVDARTTVVVRSDEALRWWLDQYPKAKVVS